MQHLWLVIHISLLLPTSDPALNWLQKYIYITRHIDVRNATYLAYHILLIKTRSVQKQSDSEASPWISFWASWGVQQSSFSSSISSVQRILVCARKYGEVWKKIIHVIQNKWLPPAASILVSLSGANNRIRVVFSSIIVVMLSTVGRLTSLVFLCFIYNGIFSSPVQNSGTYYLTFYRNF